MPKTGVMAFTLVIALVLSAQAQSNAANTANAMPQAKCGGVELSLPGPEGDFIEAGDRLRTGLFELLTPSTNRLLTAYVPAKVQQELLSGKASGGLGVYAMVQVSRQAEYADVTPQDFEQGVNTIASSMGSIAETVKDNVTDEINVRLKQFGGKSIATDRPEILGVVFRKVDAMGVAMLMGVKEAGAVDNVTMASTFAILRVKQRAVFAYIYQRYDSPETVKSLGKMLEVWTDRIVSANK
jgi:hypothetical protein